MISKQTVLICDGGLHARPASDFVACAKTFQSAVTIRNLDKPERPATNAKSIMRVLAEGISSISEGVWSNRFRYVDELCKMGARISVDGSTATFVGSAKLTGAPVVAFDLRAGAAMIIAGMIASGQTEITNVEVIDRGFYNIVGKLKKLGADIRRTEE